MPPMLAPATKPTTVLHSMEPAERPVPDIITHNLKVLFCGINPGLYSAATGHHFARPGNRFWPALHLAGFTPRVFLPAEGDQLLQLGYGITNVVHRPSRGAAELSREEMEQGGVSLRARVLEHRPRWLAVVGVQAYRVAFGQPKATVGRQDLTVGDTKVWVLPNPSGLNAHYTLQGFADAFRELRLAAEEGEH
jgi:double-stranded uracil-DNA glycosylase